MSTANTFDSFMSRLDACIARHGMLLVETMRKFKVTPTRSIHSSTSLFIYPFICMRQEAPVHLTLLQR